MHRALNIIFLLAGLALAQPALAATKWTEAKTRHFIVYSDQSEAEVRAFATQLEAYDSAIRSARGMPASEPAPVNRLTIYVLPDEAAIQRIYGYSGVAGFYIPRASGSVAYVHRHVRNVRGALNGQTVLLHEYFHHVMLQDLTVALPAWMVEGYAEFFGTAQFGKDGSVGFGAAADHRGYGLNYNDQALSLKSMLGLTYYNLTGAEYESIYGKGWLLTHFLAFEPARRGQVDRYVKAIQRGEPALKSAEAAFGDLGKLDRELAAYMKRKTLPFQSVPASRIDVGPIAVRSLSEAEGASIPLRMWSDRGVNPTEARRIAGEARQAAQKFPNEPTVLTALAEAELDTRRYVAASEAADRALVLRPESTKALMLKGQALQGAAKENPKAADWKAIRAWYLKANRLEPEAPGPLVLFYRSFKAAGLAPSASAIDGLMFAFETTPQDSNLRTLVVRELLQAKQLAEAQRVFAPVAYSSHADRRLAKNPKILAAIEQGDAAAALTLLGKDEDQSN